MTRRISQIAVIVVVSAILGFLIGIKVGADALQVDYAISLDVLRKHLKERSGSDAHRMRRGISVLMYQSFGHRESHVRLVLTMPRKPERWQELREEYEEFMTAGMIRSKEED